MILQWMETEYVGCRFINEYLERMSVHSVVM
jgi:hypothetical protein